MIIIDFHLLSLIFIYYHYIITSQKKAKAALQIGTRQLALTERGGGSGDIKIQAGPVVYRAKS